MARLVHSRGDLEMNIDGIDVEGNALRITGQMGVWTAQMLLGPEEVVAVLGFLLGPQVVRYMFLLPWRLLRSRRRRAGY